MFSVFKFFFRFSGYIILASALVAVVADASKSIARSELVTVPFGQMWFELSPETLNMAQAAIQRHVSPQLWDPFIQTLLTWPVWVVLAPLGLLLLWMGARRQGPEPVFA